jgi:AcrR family transcriptional regulator
MPRTVGSEGQRTRAAILRQAADLATVNGLNGLTIASLADALGMSKSGLYAHFKSKEELQLATIEEAERIVDDQVIARGLQVEGGVERLCALCDAYFDYLQGRCFPGGCFFAVTALEMGSRPGRVKERVAQVWRGFVELLRQNAQDAIGQHQLPRTENPDAVAFELNGIMLAADVHFVLLADEGVLEIARQAVRRRLGISGSARRGAKA